MIRETYLQRTARQRREGQVEFHAHATWLLKRFVLGAFLIYGLPALFLLLKVSRSNVSLNGVLWMFIFGAVLTAPTFLIWALGGVRAFIPKRPELYERVRTGHGFSVRPPDVVLQTFLAASCLLFFFVGYYLMLGPVILL